ncbi:MAG: methyltransferase domain-containing protein [Gammaproteobacteria bacterium]|nr:methyltransferase domain-containing protein [Gammaproteobacteria bacterium]
MRCPVRFSCRPWGRLIAAAFVAFSTAGWAAEEASVSPGVNRQYLRPDVNVAEWVDRFEGESREIHALRHAIADAVGIEAGDVVADVGAGTGLFVPLFAARAGSDGHVYALDIAPKFAAHIRDRVDEAGLAGVSVVLSQERSITLPRDSIDIVFLCDVYHHLEYPQTVLGSIRHALRPSGRLVVIDFERIPGATRPWILGHVRAGRETVVEEIQAAGFILEEMDAVDGLQENYFLRFRNP